MYSYTIDRKLSQNAWVYSYEGRDVAIVGQWFLTFGQLTATKYTKRMIFLLSFMHGQLSRFNLLFLHMHPFPVFSLCHSLLSCCYKYAILYLSTTPASQPALSPNLWHLSVSAIYLSVVTLLTPVPLSDQILDCFSSTAHWFLMSPVTPVRVKTLIKNSSC